MAAEQAAIRMAVQQVVSETLPGARASTLGTVQASLDQLMAGMQTTANRVDIAEAAISKVGHAVDQITSTRAQRLDDMEGEMATITAEARWTANDVEAEKKTRTPHEVGRRVQQQQSNAGRHHQGSTWGV